MKKGIKSIVSLAVALIVLVAAWQGIMMVAASRTSEVAIERFVDATLVIVIVAVALIIVSWVFSFLKK